MADVSAIVLKRSIPAATLTDSQGVVRFQYLPEYLETDAPAVATSLPKTAEVLSLANGATPAYFSGLLPEGRRLNAIAKSLKTSASHELNLLLALGADAIGDVQVVDPNAIPIGSTAIELPRDTSKLNFAQLQDQYFGSAATGLPGFQDKISSKMLNAPAKKSGLEYIIKFNSAEAPHAVENEYFFLGLARAVGLTTAEFELLIDETGERALQLHRLDRLPALPQTRRLAMEDACQVLGLYPSQKYDVDFETAAAGLMELCSSRKVAALNLIRQLSFNYLIGNGDAHAKNFSVLQEPSGEWRISPAYDLLCTAYYEDNEMALSVDGKKSGWSRVSLTSFAETIGVPADLTNRILDELIRKLGDFTSQLDSGALPFRRDQNYDVTKLLRARARALSS